MFSGIVEAKSKLLSFKPENQSVQIHIRRPESFKDLHIGDSIAVNGVCLTVTDFSQEKIGFVLGTETLQVLGWTEKELSSRELNLERSLQMGDRIHGHIVLGHVDGVATCVASKPEGDCHILRIRLPEKYISCVWYKGSIALSGVSLTINKVEKNEFEVCLIPETIRATNLTSYQVGSAVPFEIDQMARALTRWFEAQKMKEAPTLTSEAT